MKELKEISPKVMEKLLNYSPVFLFTKYRVEPEGNITIYRNPKTSRIEHMNATGTVIHRLSLKNYRIRDIVEYFQSSYQPPPLLSTELLIKDIFLFLRSLEYKGIVELKWPTGIAP